MKKIIIIGAGPGGYETAIKAAENGFDVTLVSMGEIGGTCLNEGCIPTKCLCANASALDLLDDSERFGISDLEYSFDIRQAYARKNEVVSQLRGGIEFLLNKHKVNLVYGRAEFIDNHKIIVHATDNPLTKEFDEKTFEADYIIMATGSVSATLPIEGNDLEGVITSREMLELDHIPQSLCIIGAGVIGLEFASIFNSFGSEVTVVEYCKNILPHFDKDLAKRLKKELTKRGVVIETGAAVQGIIEATVVNKNDEGEETETGKTLVVKYEKKGKEEYIPADKVLMAVGRRPAISSLNLDTIGVQYDRTGVKVDENMRTNVENIYSIGDLNGGLMLAHVAEYQGKVALRSILGSFDGNLHEGNLHEGNLHEGNSHERKNSVLEVADLVPATVFTAPEVAMIGLTEESAKERGLKFKVLKSNYLANGKAISMGEQSGYFKMLVLDDPDREFGTNGQILGCHIFGTHAADLVHEIAVLMHYNATAEEVANIIHAHPTLSEIIYKAIP